MVLVALPPKTPNRSIHSHKPDHMAIKPGFGSSIGSSIGLKRTLAPDGNYRQPM